MGTSSSIIELGDPMALLSEFGTIPATEEVDMNIVLNAYLVMRRAKPAFLLESADYNSSDWERRALICARYFQSLQLPYRRVLFFPPNTIEPTLIHQLLQGDDVALAKVLDFGCFDENFYSNEFTRYSYVYTAKKDNRSYAPHVYVCTEEKKPNVTKLDEQLRRFQSTLGELGFTVEMEVRKVLSKHDVLHVMRKIVKKPSHISKVLSAPMAEEIANELEQLGYYKAANMFKILDLKAIKKHRHALMALYLSTVHDRASPMYPVTTEMSEKMAVIAEKYSASLFAEL